MPFTYNPLSSDIHAPLKLQVFSMYVLTCQNIYAKYLQLKWGMYTRGVNLTYENRNLRDKMKSESKVRVVRSSRGEQNNC